MSEGLIFPSRLPVKKLYVVFLCNKKYFLLLLLLNKDTLKSRELIQILPNPEVNAMERNVGQNDAKFIVTQLRNIFSFKSAVSMQDPGMVGCMLHCSLDQRLLRLGKICQEFSVHLVEMGEIWRKGKSGDKQALQWNFQRHKEEQRLKNHIVYVLIIYFPQAPNMTAYCNNFCNYTRSQCQVSVGGVNLKTHPDKTGVSSPAGRY